MTHRTNAGFLMPEFRGIVRIIGKDIDGNAPLNEILADLKGVGMNLGTAVANVASRELKIDPRIKVGDLSEEQVDALEDIITNPEKHGIPAWMQNRRRELASGKDSQTVGADLGFKERQDIEFLKTMRCYRGIRHAFGLPVRGQRTKTMGRSGMTLGVQKSKVKEAAAAAKKGGAEEKGKKK